MGLRSATAPPRCELHARIPLGCGDVLSPGALGFVAELTRRFRPRLTELLRLRRERRAAFRNGARLDFLAETQSIRDAEWRIAPVPKDLERRVVEITGPVDRKMIINALNSGADTFMADFEDATSPTFANLVAGQRNLHDAVCGTIEHDDPTTGRRYRLNDKTAVLIARPRGLHLPEGHLTVDGAALPASLFDAGLFLFHDARALLERGSGPYLYLPKLESRLEARWWNDVFVAAEELLDLARGSIKATVLIETLPAAFEMDEILFELKDHAAGLNCGRWDYIFSFIKEHAEDPTALLPDRAQVTMEQPFLRAYSRLLIKTCHRRGAHAIGGMAAQIPQKDDPAANEIALARVRADKLREVTDGHDGTWVAHPGLVPVARAVFAAHMDGPHQLHVARADVNVTAKDLLRVPAGTRTDAGLRQNVRVAIRYLEAWLSGTGCVPLYGLMEDAATAEISRTQVWQWIRHGALTREHLATVVREELARIESEVGPTRFVAGRFDAARDLFETSCGRPTLDEFLTLAAYDRLGGGDPTPST